MIFLYFLLFLFSSLSALEHVAQEVAEKAVPEEVKAAQDKINAAYDASLKAALAKTDADKEKKISSIDPIMTNTAAAKQLSMALENTTQALKNWQTIEAEFEKIKQLRALAQENEQAAAHIDLDALNSRFFDLGSERDDLRYTYGQQQRALAKVQADYNKAFAQELESYAQKEYAEKQKKPGPKKKARVMPIHTKQRDGLFLLCLAHRTQLKAMY